MRPNLMLALLALTACAPKPLARPAPLPGPTVVHEFTLPKTETRTLSNGLRVVVATNSEVPTWDMRLLFNVGAFADPVGKEGLASVTLDMMNDGAGTMSAEDISRELKRLGSSLGSSADEDGAAIGAAGLKRNLEPTLDLFAKIVMEPTFPEADWTVNKSQRIAGLKATRQDPVAISGRVWPTLVYTGTYRARLPTEAAYESLTIDDMKAFREKYLGPTNAILLVGGDLTADEVVPLLEARFAAWKPTTVTSYRPDVVLAEREPTLYLIDKPGAAQSVVRVIGTAPLRTSDDYYSMMVASQAFGGAFTSRLNLNLREDKGYTYGARCGTVERYGPSFWTCSTSVATAVTGPAIEETRKELTLATTEKPFTEAEVTDQKNGVVLSFPGDFELTGTILGEQTAIWRYGYPEDMTERYVPGVNAVTVDSANTAFRNYVIPGALTWLVVGDADKIRSSIDGLGMKVVELDRDGHPVGSK